MLKEEAVKQAKRYYGLFTLMTNQAIISREVLTIYHHKDLVKKAFGNLKERLNLRCMLVCSEQSLEGKLFVAFVALIYLSHLKKKMQEATLFKTYSISRLLDKLDVIERFEVPGGVPYIDEILNVHKAIY